MLILFSQCLALSLYVQLALAKESNARHGLGADSKLKLIGLYSLIYFLFLLGYVGRRSFAELASGRGIHVVMLRLSKRNHSPIP